MSLCHFFKGQLRKSNTMIYSVKPPRLKILSSACVMLRPSLYPVMHIRDTGLVARACEFLQVYE